MENVVIYNKKEINDTLSCSVCLEYYTDPRNLLCGHSFCIECLKILKVSDNVIVCPLCRFKTQLFNLSINDLPLNSYIVSIIDIKDIKDNQTIEKINFKKSKSVDCLCINKYNNNNININKCNNNNINFTKHTFHDYDSDDEYTTNNKFCCYQ